MPRERLDRPQVPLSFASCPDLLAPSHPPQPAMPNTESCIQSDPDISGIGVRVAIYVQNLIGFVPAVWALWDGKVTLYELESAETQSTTILITAFAVLISAMVEAKTYGLSNFHANIVLYLSWMNNTNTFIYFLLYLQHKSQPRRRCGRTEVVCLVKAR
jgi:hypothetical protein